MVLFREAIGVIKKLIEYGADWTLLDHHPTDGRHSFYDRLMHITRAKNTELRNGAMIMMKELQAVIDHHLAVITRTIWQSFHYHTWCGCYDQK